jgi:hypothetical protein
MDWSGDELDDEEDGYGSQGSYETGETGQWRGLAKKVQVARAE